jgi:hypothetical protein
MMNDKVVPGPKRAFPFGSAFDFAGNPPHFLNRLADEYGDIVRFYFFGRSLYMVNNPDYIRGSGVAASQPGRRAIVSRPAMRLKVKRISSSGGW